MNGAGVVVVITNTHRWCSCVKWLVEDGVVFYCCVKF